MESHESDQSSQPALMRIFSRLLSWQKLFRKRLPALFTWGIILVLSALALVCLLNDFVRHLTPDISVYLLHARTFLQELNRFTASHDSKGIVLMFILAPVVRLFGATMFAAAVAQFFAFAAAFTCCFFIIRTYAGRIAAVIISLLAFCILNSFYLWEANARPENFALAFTFIALAAAMRGTRRFLAVAGAMIALSVFLKTTLVFAPVAIVLFALIFNIYDYMKSGEGKSRSQVIRLVLGDAAWAFAGFAVVCVLILGWIVLFDDIHGWYRQTISWPMQSRMVSAAPWNNLGIDYRLFGKAHLQPLLLAGILGLVFGWIRGWRRETFLLVAATLGEWYRISVEGASWAYVLVILVPLLLIGAGMLGAAGSRRSRSILVWLTPLIFIVPIMPNLAKTELRAFNLRFIQRLPSPTEKFAQLLQPYYRKGESILPVYNDYQMILLMNAPRPAPILPRHFGAVSAQEQSVTRQYYEKSPPDWIIQLVSLSETPLSSITGGVDYAYYVQFPDPDGSTANRDSTSRILPGDSLSPMLPSSADYQVELDNGFLRAWHIFKPPSSPDTVSDSVQTPNEGQNP